MITAKRSTKESAAQMISHQWGGLTPEQAELLTGHLEIRRFKKNEIIYRGGEPPTHILCLFSGKVKIYKEGIAGKSQILRAIKPGEFFAYRAYFASETYRTAAMAIENCTVALLPIGILIKLMEQNHNVSLYFIKYLCYEIGKSDDRTVNLTQKHVRGRLAEALLFLRESYGCEADGQTLNITMSREDLANLSNMTTNNAIRTLSALASEGLLQLEGKKIKILNRRELRRISEEVE